MLCCFRGVVTLTATLAAMLALLLLGSPSAAAASWDWPLPPPHEVVHGFDPPAQPWLPGHRGVDLRGRAGEIVRAAGAGTVEFAGPVGGVPVVSIRHAGGLLTTYEPVRASVRRGEAVTLGDRIGRLVRAGSHCAPQPCLHWGLRRDETYLDPLALLGPVQARLLPLYDGSSGSTPAGVLGGAVAGSATGVGGWWFLSRRRRRQTP